MKGLQAQLANGGSIVVAEGYTWELERRGLLQFGNYMPEVVLEKPEAVEMLHEEFALAGSDVIEACTYYGNREIMKQRGREEDLERLNRDALSIARRVADNYGKLMAGGLCNTPLYKEDDERTHRKIYDIFKEQVEWAVEGGADYMIGETFDSYGEAKLALHAIQDYGNGMPAVITMSAHAPDRTTDEVPIPEACKRLEDQGATVVGLNCSRGPDVMMPLIKEIQNVCSVPIAALPVPYRTSDKERTFFAIKDPKSGTLAYPDNLDCVRCSRVDVRKFAEGAKQIGIQYIGLCCGNSPNLTREIAEVYNKNPPASKYSTCTQKSLIFGDQSSVYGSKIIKLRQFMMGE